jgi:hypothetical protein
LKEFPIVLFYAVGVVAEVAAVSIKLSLQIIGHEMLRHVIFHKDTSTI